MKALPFQVSGPKEESVKVEFDKLPHFYDRLHYHVENQLTVIHKSHGTLYVGDKIDGFNEGDVFLIGKNLPHVFRNDPIFYRSKGFNAEATSIYFTSEFLGDAFLALPECQEILKLLENAYRGLRIKGETAKYCRESILKIANLEGMDKIIQMLSVLSFLGRSQETEQLASIGYTNPRKDSDNAKINTVFDFLVSTFQNEIRLDEVAEVGNMSPTAFCRYFKKHTRKTLSQFITELRIGHACRLLLESSLSISEVCYNSGFNNISNFNRQFKKQTGYTPSAYHYNR